MLPPPLRSTLFPYTTLFRSGDAASFGWLGATFVAPTATVPSLFTVACGEPDRKSTRLNSSHITISYAVFCLKKKNKKTLRAHNLLSSQYPLHLCQTAIPLST